MKLHYRVYLLAFFEYLDSHYWAKHSKFAFLKKIFGYVQEDYGEYLGSFIGDLNPNIWIRDYLLANMPANLGMHQEWAETIGFKRFLEKEEAYIYMLKMLEHHANKCCPEIKKFLEAEKLSSNVKTIRPAEMKRWKEAIEKAQLYEYEIIEYMEIYKRNEAAFNFYDKILRVECIYYCSDEMSLRDLCKIYKKGEEESAERVKKEYGVEVTDRELSMPFWQLLDLLYGPKALIKLDKD